MFIKINKKYILTNKKYLKKIQNILDFESQFITNIY